MEYFCNYLRIRLFAHSCVGFRNNYAQRDVAGVVELGSGNVGGQALPNAGGAGDGRTAVGDMDFGDGKVDAIDELKDEL